MEDLYGFFLWCHGKRDSTPLHNRNAVDQMRVGNAAVVRRRGEGGEVVVVRFCDLRAIEVVGFEDSSGPKLLMKTLR